MHMASEFLHRDRCTYNCAEPTFNFWTFKVKALNGKFTIFPGIATQTNVLLLCYHWFVHGLAWLWLQFCVGGRGRKTADITFVVVVTGLFIGFCSPQSAHWLGMYACILSRACCLFLLKCATYCVKPFCSQSCDEVWFTWPVQCTLLVTSADRVWASSMSWFAIVVARWRQADVV